MRVCDLRLRSMRAPLKMAVAMALATFTSGCGEARAVTSGRFPTPTSGTVCGVPLTADQMSQVLNRPVRIAAIREDAGPIDAICEFQVVGATNTWVAVAGLTSSSFAFARTYGKQAVTAIGDSAFWIPRTPHGYQSGLFVRKGPVYFLVSYQDPAVSEEDRLRVDEEMAQVVVGNI